MKFQAIVIIIAVCSVTSIGQPATTTSEEALTALRSWIATPPSSRNTLAAQPFAPTPLTKTDAQTARTLLWEERKASLKEELSTEWQKKEMVNGAFRMKFDYRTFGKKPDDGRSLFISMHGGGNAPAATNDQQWQNQITLYQPAEGIYLAPRAPTDSWNMWFQDNVDPLFDRIIRAAVVNLDVNPDKVYLMGYSAGGDGAYQMGPRMADRWAAAAAMAGHPNDASPRNLRNIGFNIHVGGDDTSYGRNTIALTWKQQLDSLQQLDTAGYHHSVTVHAGLPHWMNLEDSVAVSWMMQFRRNPTPKKIVWRNDNVPHTTFYWLGIPLSQAKKGSEIVATCSSQTITVERSIGIDSVTLYLNDALLDLDLPVTLKAQGATLFTGIVNRTIATIAAITTDRSDQAMVFSAQLAVDLKNGTVALNPHAPHVASSSGRIPLRVWVQNQRLHLVNPNQTTLSNISLFSIDGKLITSQSLLLSNHSSINLSTLPHGSYIVACSKTATAKEGVTFRVIY